MGHLEDCPTCQNPTSANALSCPKCGEPLQPGWADTVAEARATEVEAIKRKLRHDIEVQEREEKARRGAAPWARAPEQRKAKRRGGMMWVAAIFAVIAIPYSAFEYEEYQLEILSEEDPAEYARIMAEQGAAREARKKAAEAEKRRKGAAMAKQQLAQAHAGLAKRKAEAAKERCQSELSAFGATEHFVKPKLKAPSTADFASIADARISSPECGVWVVRSHVDSENGFGAMIRTHFVIRIKYYGGDRWELVDFQTD